MAGKRKNKDERIPQVLDQLLNYTQMNFRARGPVSDKGDEIDAIIVGLNTLGEELEAAIVSGKAEEREVTAALFTHAPMGVIVIDAEGKIVYWNSKAESIFGWTAREVTGSYLHNTIIPPEYREAHKKGLKRFMQTGEGPVLNKPVELPARRKDNSTFDAGITISPAHIGGRQLFIGFISDVSYRKKEVDENASRLAAIVDSSDDAIISKSLEGVIQTWNRSAQRIFGYAAVEAIGTHVSLIIPPDLLDEERQILENIRRGIKVEHFETERLAKDGRRICVALTVSPVQNRSGKVIGASTIARDISKRKEEEREMLKRTEYMETRVSELLDVLLRYTLLDFSVTARIGERGDEFDAIAVGLNTMAEELQAEVNRRKAFEEALLEKSNELASSNRDLENFAYIASHDLQEPLRMVSSFLQLLQKKLGNDLDQDSKDYIFYAVDGAKRMKDMINDLLSYSRITSRKADFTEVDVGAVVEEVMSNFQEKITESKAEVKVGKLPVVKADRIKMVRLFQNLLGNALKFTKNGEAPRVHISCNVTSDEYIFTVKDEGIGMKPEYFSKIFGIFQRLHSQTEYQGTGIGLAECKKIVELHGGRIWVESEPGNGAAFHFTINRK